MARRKKLTKVVFGVLLGVLISQFSSREECKQPKPAPRVAPAAPAHNLVFVGVMTAARYLDTRAKAVYDTWGRKVPGKVMFFSSEDSYSEDVPLVALPGVDDTYPPQKKSFMMLKHMYDHYIDQYEWFLRADDDVYVRTDRLEELLRSVDSKKPWFIGQTGRGNTEEFGMLSLESDENFCMGGPGVIFSRETLKRMAPYVDECLANLYTTHEDVELGRCVRRFAGISCTWSYEASDCDCEARLV
jgi:chondroitin sulfate synthase